MFHFIERRLLNDGTVDLAATTPSDTWLRAGRARGTRAVFTVGSIPRAIRLPTEPLKIVRWVFCQCAGRVGFRARTFVVGNTKPVESSNDPK